MNNKRIVYNTPECLNEKTIRLFLKTIEPIFKLGGKEIPCVFFDTTSTKQINLLGLLVIYKFLDYTVTNKCFKDPHCNITQLLVNEFKKNGFYDLVNAYVSNLQANYDDLEYREHNGLFIAPIALDRENKILASAKIQNKISDYYKDEGLKSFAVLTCIIEIISNFAAHAIEDTKSVLVASGDMDYFELACADTGVGIANSLRNAFQLSKLCNMNNYDIIAKAMEKGVTSKSDKTSGHMGRGLWIVNQFVNTCNGDLYVFSNGAYYHNCNGKIKNGECANWKGTIIYLKLSLKNPDEILNAIKKMDNKI